MHLLLVHPQQALEVVRAGGFGRRQRDDASALVRPDAVEPAQRDEDVAAVVTALRSYLR